MRKDLVAIEAIASGLLDGGCEVFTNFPGFMSHKLFSSLGGKITSVNEKIAYEAAWGASFAGKRSVVTFKNVGLNDAADPFLNSMIVGVNAGLVLIVFDDMHVEGSQSRQDSRHYFDFFGGLWFEPYSLQNAYDVAYQSFELSEKFQIPVVIRITNQMVYAKGCYKRKRVQRKNSPIIKDHARFVVHPINSATQRKSLSNKNKKIRNFINKLYKKELTNFDGVKKLLLSFGCNLIEEEKYLNKGFKKLQIFTYPIPDNIRSLINRSYRVVVLEQGDGFAKEKIMALFSNKRIEANLGRIPDNSSGYIVSNNYRKLFLAIKRVKPSFVVGDLGEYTQDTLDTIDACLCFGSALSVGMGGILAGAENVISVIGDGAYLHSGKNVIPEAIKREAPLKIIIICNGGCKGTGGQEVPGELFYQPKAVEKYLLKYREISTNEFEETLYRMLKSYSVSVLYVLM
jgi:indolepyruvate ferredoxin oxidoreductase alpha subunit